jgi:Ecdysteroid kinase-like family
VVIVVDPAELTPVWLSEVLAGAGIDAVVSDVGVAAVGTGQMASCYRLTVSYARGEGPAQLIAKLPSNDPVVRAGAAMMYRTEVSFYRDLAPRLAIPVPRCYCAVMNNDATSFTLLLEDMFPATVGDQLAGCTAEQARDAVVAVAGLHAGSWCDSAMRRLESIIPSAADLAQLTASMIKDSVQTFLSRRQLDAATAEVFAGFAANFTWWATGRPTPFALVHNDYRLDNLLFAPAGSDLPAVTTVDWQSLSTGLPLRDVAYLIGTGLDQDTRREHEQAIVGAYHDRLVALGVKDYAAAQCWEDYRYGLFQGPYICIMGEAVAAPTERGRAMFTVMAERSAAAIRELGSLELLS